jgi:hypothetical protein
MTDVTPLHPVETVEGALRNALTIAEMGRDGYLHDEVREGYQDMARLLRHTLNGLSEVSPAAVSEALVLIRCLPAYAGLEALTVTEREARDIAAAILDAQLRGAPPPQPNTQPSEDT